MDIQVTFRRAVRDDVPAVVALLADDVLGRDREPQGEAGVVDPAYWTAFDRVDEDGRQLLAVAERSGEVIGTLQLSFIPYLTFGGRERAQIEAVRVASSTRGEGIGRRMLQWAIEQARARGCHLVQLTTNKQRLDARRFYESLGFESTHEGMKLELDREPGCPWTTTA